MIALCSYAGFMENSTQYQWLAGYLSTRINRKRTPWVMVTMHVPLYSSNNGHWGEGELFRISMEPLLYKYGVDVILAGHVHSYERTVPVYNKKANPCGPTYLNLGDGGNYEGAYTDWRNINGTSTYSGSEWSAFREGSFGVASLVLLNENQANFSWHRHACMSNSATAFHANFSDNCVTPGDNSAQNMLTSDSAIIVRPSQAYCPNRYVSTESGTDMNNLLSTADYSSADSSSSGKDQQVVIGLSVAVTLLSIACIVMGILLFTGGKKSESDESLLNQNINDFK